MTKTVEPDVLEDTQKTRETEMDNTRMETSMDTSISSAHHTRFALIRIRLLGPILYTK